MRVLTADYLEKFKCIGAECEDTCCSGWNVNIDQKSFEIFQDIPDPRLRDSILVNIGEAPNPSTMIRAQIKMKPSGDCPFLTEDRLCQIQRNLGHSYLPLVCNFYPRVENIVFSQTERVATMACPEAARLALLRKDGIRFHQTEVEPHRWKGIFVKQVMEQNGAKNGHIFFSEIRSFCLWIIQNRAIELNDRMVILGMFCKNLSDLISRSQVEQIPGEIEKFRNAITSGSLTEILVNIPSAHQVQAVLLSELMRDPLVRSHATKRYRESLDQALSGLRLDNSQNDLDLSRYTSAISRFLKPFIFSDGYLLENYLANYIFKELFPMGSSADVFAEYTLLATQFGLIKLLLTGLGVHHNGISLELAVKLIQSFARTYEHHPEHLDRIMEALRASGYTSLAYMSILVKN